MEAGRVIMGTSFLRSGFPDYPAFSPSANGQSLA